MHCYTFFTLRFMVFALGLIATGPAPSQTMPFNRQFTTPSVDRATAVAADESGIYVAGVRPSPQGSLNRAGLRKYDALGNELWTRDFVTPAYITAVTADASGVYVGSAMGPSEFVPLRVNDGKLATALADTRILFNGVPAPLLYVSDKQSSAIVPYAVAGQSSVDVQVEYKGVRSEAVTTPVLTSRPGIFSLDSSGQGQGAILNEDGSLNSPANPARRGSVLTLYATGGGEAAPGVEDGQILGKILPRTSLPVSTLFDLGSSEFQVPSKSGEVLYAGGVSGSVAGLLQVNVRVPANAVATGNAVPFVLLIGSRWTVYQARIALR